MRNKLPTAKQVREILKVMKLADLDAIAEQAGMSKAAIYKIRYEVTKNPGIDTVGKILATPTAIQKIKEHPGILPY